MSNFSPSGAVIASQVSRRAQGSRGATRLRGFITEELFNAFQLDLASFKFIVEFAVNNAYDVAKLRNTPPFSASNETQHGILRLKSRKMVISTVARSAAQVMECSRILSDNVRTFHTGIGLGTTYASSFNNDAQVRSDAIAEHKRKTAEDPEHERLIQLKKPMRKH